MECPSCKLINPAHALSCDCGYSFETGAAPSIDASRMVKHVTAIACLWLAIGAVLVIYGVNSLVQAGRSEWDAWDVVSVLFGAGSIAMYYELRRFKFWARTVTIIMGCVMFANPVGWYVLWAMTRPELKTLFRAGGSASAMRAGQVDRAREA
jgi:hypothetical protein